ncbi:hypothetical protein HAX54_019951 [Datura stramonium]|uniref:Uncharacterized protein n=1 Tax=Datura stramonium TaxID=4076 RepID=A0ABS8US43_DATST|nr:hypothetical protein [Datura stramonium]
MKAIKAKSHSDTEIIDSKGANSEIPSNMLDDYNKRRGEQHVAPQSGNESGDTVPIDATFNEVLYDMQNMGKANLNDTEDDTFMETKNDICHEDVSLMEKDSNTKIKISFVYYLLLDDAGIMRKDTDWSRDESYMDKIQFEPLDVRKCDIYVATYAEYLSNGVDIYGIDFEANLHQSRYDALLWDYGSQKIEDSAINDNEAPTKPDRKILKRTISQPDIVIEYILF